MGKRKMKLIESTDTSSNQDSMSPTPTPNPKRQTKGQMGKQEAPAKKKQRVEELLEDDDFDTSRLASTILRQREEDPSTPRKPGRSIGSGLGSPHKAEHEYSDNPRTAYGRAYRKQLSPREKELELAKGRDRNAKFNTLKKLRSSTEWLEANEEERGILEADAVEALEESRFRGGQSAEWLENQLLALENTAKVQRELKDAVEAEEDLEIAGKTKIGKMQKKEVPEGAHPQIGEVVGRNLGLLVRRWERISYMAGRRNLEMAGDPNPRVHMRHFRQQVTDPENIRNMEVNYDIPPAAEPTISTDVKDQPSSAAELPTPEGVVICLSDDEGSMETLGSEGVDDFIVDDSEEESLAVVEYSDDASLDLQPVGDENDTSSEGTETSEDDTSDEDDLVKGENEE